MLVPYVVVNNCRNVDSIKTDLSVKISDNFFYSGTKVLEIKKDYSAVKCLRILSKY